MNSALEKICNQFPADLPTEPCRLFHGRGATVPGCEFLTIDWYPPLVLITLYENRDSAWIDQLGEQLRSSFANQLAGIIVQSRASDRAGAKLLYGSIPEQCIIQENGLRYRIDPLAEQNIGFFPDMKSGRKLIYNISSNKKILNLFAYTCSLSVAAIAGGARQVVNLDMNRNLLNWGKENHQLNGHDLRDVSFLAHNLFKSFGRLRQTGPFDLVIIDPPYRQGESFQAERDWPKIITRLSKLLVANGEIVAAVSAPELGRQFLRDQFQTNLPQAKLLQELIADTDFPEADPDKGLHIQHYQLQDS